jgi:uncharacterized heparinase superfamily protein
MGPLATIDRYRQTLRWLKPVQVYGRLLFRLARPRPDTRPAPAPRTPSGDWCTPARRQASLTGPGAFQFLNQPGNLAEDGWDDPARDKLWRYNQHYFDDLNAEDASARSAWQVELLDHWLAHNPPGSGSGWEPYPTSLRIVNWIKWALAGNTLNDTAVHSLAVQVRWLGKRLEWHLLGNHLFANAKALVFAGLWFDGSEAKAWLDKGFEILARQVPEQILSDGGQFELSPMYHALALEDVLDLINICRRFGDALSPDHVAEVERIAARVTAMRAWLAAMSHPDGRIAFFNDAAFGIAPENSELEDYARRLGFGQSTTPGPRCWLSDSGYARLSQPDAVLIADLAKVGPDYLPGHAHADTLSFELSVHGQRLFVNSGTSAYGLGPERLRQRGTAAHNTLQIEGGNSSDVWGGFRVGLRARPHRRLVTQIGQALTAQASHDGYRRLPGKPSHHRQWTFSATTLRIQDEIGSKDLAADVRFHLHPDVQAEVVTGDKGTFTLPSGQIVLWHAWGDGIRIEPSTWHPEFGVSRPSRCLVVPVRGRRAALDISWS